jgi:hypothetical protein
LLERRRLIVKEGGGEEEEEEQGEECRALCLQDYRRRIAVPKAIQKHKLEGFAPNLGLNHMLTNPSGSPR